MCLEEIQKGMTVFDEIHNILSELKSLQNREIDKFLFKKNSRSFILQINDESLVEIQEDSILVVGGNATTNILPMHTSSMSDCVEAGCIQNFFSALGSSIIRLNHLGINYSCSSIEHEIVVIKKLLHNTNFKLYEESSGFTHQRWFFIGSLESWENPLFEIVLTESQSPLCTKWTPHFQIDLDTKLHIEELEFLTNKHLKEGFIDWKLDVPNYGVVLGMGQLSNIYGTKVYLGLGTGKRNTKFHREEILKLV